MQPEQAKFLMEHYAEVSCYEMDITTRVIAAMPANQPDYAPDAKSMKALHLAWHIASSECWFLRSLINGAFAMEGEATRPAELSDGAKIVEWYKASIMPLWEQVRKLDPAKLATPMDFFGLYNFPAVAYLSFMSRHAIHHRGQLSAYLRPMGGKVPSIYGGSADEPFEAPK
jgi:uncharacterized damage-inducible protein DinB